MPPQLSQSGNCCTIAWSNKCGVYLPAHDAIVVSTAVSKAMVYFPYPHSGRRVALCPLDLGAYGTCWSYYWVPFITIFALRICRDTARLVHEKKLDSDISNTRIQTRELLARTKELCDQLELTESAKTLASYLQRLPTGSLPRSFRFPSRTFAYPSRGYRTESFAFQDYQFGLLRWFRFAPRICEAPCVAPRAGLPSWRRSAAADTRRCRRARRLR